MVSLRKPAGPSLSDISQSATGERREHYTEAPEEATRAHWAAKERESGFGIREETAKNLFAVSSRFPNPETRFPLWLLDPAFAIADINCVAKAGDAPWLVVACCSDWRLESQC
jgi:hypothetical protein